MKLIRLALIALGIAVAAPASYSCSRLVLRSDTTDVVMVGRTLDWRTPIPTNLYVYPAGMSKVSMPEGPRFEWTSKYGSVLAVGYDGGVTEGMNERGLVINGLFCKNSVYREAPTGSDVPIMSLAVFVSYMLDNFATTDEVRDFLANTEFGIAGKTFDGGTVSLLHWGITDASGNTLILEFVDGKIDLYESKDYRMLTNDPTFPEMQAINKYWQGIGGMNMLPGTVRSSDRFVRGDYFVRHVPAPVVADDHTVAELGTVIDNVAVPMGYEIPGQPNLSSTQWRSIADINRLRYYFKFSDSLGYFYVDLQHLMLRPGSPVLKLDTSDHADFFGNINHRLKVSKPFTPMY